MTGMITLIRKVTARHLRAGEAVTGQKRPRDIEADLQRARSPDA